MSDKKEEDTSVDLLEIVELAIKRMSAEDLLKAAKTAMTRYNEVTRGPSGGVQ